MKKLSFNEVRKEFLDFFESKDHIRLKSYSLIPNNDKSLLLINAGMAPLKEYFMGTKKFPKNRATSSQRCIRTGDIDNVGKTHRHATFFEMLGNFSFGDYFKKEAITWAWEFLTEVIELDKDKLSVTVYHEDDEAYEIWNKHIGLPESKIKRLGKEDNFWEIEEGPCGPCSEIMYDRGDKYEGDDRYLEIWNNVFTQFNKTSDGQYLPLSHPNIDTGMGLERLALILEDAENIFELNTFKPLLEKIEDLSGKKYRETEKVDESFRVIMDHTKAMTFLIFDGVVPSNEGRGYVLRRLIRRAYRHGKLLGIEGNFLKSLSEIVMNIYISEYPEVLEDKERVFKIIEREEDNFQQTIDQGLEILNGMIQEVRNSNESVLSGKEVFKLYDTYGFPYDLTEEIAKDSNITVDRIGFDEAMKAQKELSRANKNFKGGWEEDKIDLSEYDKTEFIGYDNFESESEIVGIIGESDSISEGQKALVILNKTPFYGEGGGQVGDTGIIESETGKLIVTDTKKTGDEVYYHFVECESGEFFVGDKVIAKIDTERRNKIIRNHSVIHLLNQALKEVLGNHITQAGSYCGEDRMRFDFTHYEAISPENLSIIEQKVNKAIYDALEVRTIVTSLEESKKLGAIGVFEDKYKDIVRVVDMGGWSIELCGGTHVKNTSEILMFKITSESSVASGVRRIEGLAGLGVYDLLNSYIKKENEIVSILKVQKDRIEEKIVSMIENEKELKSRIEEFKSAVENGILESLYTNIDNSTGAKILVARLNDVDGASLKNIADKFISDSAENSVMLLASVNEGKILFASSVTKDLVQKGLKAGEIVKFAATETGGNGGGRPDFAQAGGKDVSKLEETLEKVDNFIKSKLQ